MKTLTETEIKNNLAKILDMVKNGEEIIVSSKSGKEKVAIIVPYGKYKTGKERPLGILKGKASFKIKDNFKMTDGVLLQTQKVGFTE
jgi:prevent-host-death family protein